MSHATQVSDHGLIAALYLPSMEHRRWPAVIVLSGSDGGIAGAAMYGEPLAERGYAVLALAYFAMDGLRRDLVEIPLEYFKLAIDWLRRHPAVDAERLAVLGHSRGGEAALLIAATYPEIRLAVANVPSHVVWSGIDPEPGPRRSAWSLNGVGLPFLSFLRTPDAAGTWRELFEEVLQADGTALEAAAIPVERINGPILFVTGTADAVWPCADMVDRATDRLTRNGFAFPYEHAKYADAGHVILVPPYRVGPVDNPWPSSAYMPPHWRAGPQLHAGGTAEANRRARIDAWPRLVTFLDAHL